jgi:putative beta-lysine N-acetyltransferase
MPDLTDTVERIGGSTIQHGPHSDRIYLMKLNADDLPDIIPEMDDLAAGRGYGKIFVKVPASAASLFLEHGYREEAHVPGFYHGQEAAAFLGKYSRPERAEDPRDEEIRRILELAWEKGRRPEAGAAAPPADDVEIALARPREAEAMGRLYAEVFPTYPFPIQDPDYLRETMASHVAYYCARRGGRLIALASAERDREAANVEMTDFATLPDARGLGLAKRLLSRMEAAMVGEGLCTAYTIARALSPGMNAAFARLGYVFGGTLINNTNIGGDIESMNVWHKPL